MMKNTFLAELIKAKTIDDIISKTEGARKEAKELKDKTLIMLLYNLSYYKFFERTPEKEREIYQLQSQIIEQYTKNTLIMIESNQVNDKQIDNKMKINHCCDELTDFDNTLILEPNNDLETIKDVFNSITNLKIPSHTKKMLQIIYNSYSNLKEENKELKKQLNQQKEDE